MQPNATNENGKLTGLARRAPTEPALPAGATDLMQLPPWMVALRDAMTGAVSPEVVGRVMAAQVKKAEDGDVKSASFVMNQVHKMMESQAKLQKSVTIVQNNYYDTPKDERPDAPIRPGDDANGADLRKLRNRVRAGVPLTGGKDDARVRPVSDEEEKAIRRREEAEDD